MKIDADALEILSTNECLRLLGTRSLGRIGLSAAALPLVLPVNYVLIDGVIVIRTRRETALATATRDAVVAFEVDDHDAASDLGWSVMIQGRAHETPPAIAAALVDEPALARWSNAAENRHFSISLDVVSDRRLLECSTATS